ncbi:MAG: hypothetical protein J6Z04_03855 [Clostridia bacterium]|nr:hypothetical protein [Clostridia bacterium]
MKKILSFFLLFAALFLLASCNKLHATACDVAVFYNEDRSKNTYVGKSLSDQSVFRESFLSETTVSGEWNEYAEINDPDALPSSRTILIDNQEDFDAAFADCPVEVDFDDEMIVVYTTTSVNRRETKVKGTKIDDGVLSVELYNRRPKNRGGDTCLPYQRYVIVKLDRRDVTEVKVDYTFR